MGNVAIRSSSSSWTVTKSVPMLLLLALMTALAGGGRYHFVSPQDEGVLLVYPDLILRGALPYADFATAYPPGNFYVLAGASALFGHSVFVERLVGFGYQFLIAASCFLLGARISWLTGLFSSTAALAMLAFFPTHGAYSMIGAHALALIAVLWATKSCGAGEAARESRWAVYAGLWAGAVYWFRLDAGGIGTLAALVALGPRSLRRLSAFSIGLALSLGALLALLLWIGPSEAFESLILNGARGARGRVLPVTMSFGLGVVLACVGIGVVVGLSAQFRRVREDLIWLARAIAVYSAGMLPGIFQRADLWHITYVGTAIAGLTIVSVGIAWPHAERHTLTTKRAAACIALAALIVSGACLMQYRSMAARQTRIETAEIAINGRGLALAFPKGSNNGQDLDSLLLEVNRVARPGEKLFVGPSDLRFTNCNDVFIYYLLPDLQPAARYLEMTPGVANRPDSGLAEQVAQADWLILTNQYNGWREPNASSVAGSPAPNEVVGSHYCLHSAHGAWRLFRRC